MRQWMLILAVLAAGCAPYVPVVVPPTPQPNPVRPVEPDIPNDGQRHWVVTESLAEVEPNPIPELEPVPEEQPSPFVPQVQTVCGCGCNQTGCQCGRTNAAAVQCPGDTSPVLQVNDAALETVASQQAAQQEFVDVYTPPRCGTCPQWKANLGAGHGRVRFRYIDAEPPPFVLAVTGTVPAFVHDGQVLFPTPVGHTAASIAAIVESRTATRPRGQEMRALNIGAIRGRQAVAKILDAITGTAAAPVLVFGNSSITLPPNCRFNMAASSQGAAITFAAPLPSVRYGSGLLSVARPVTSLTIGRDLVTLGIAGFPDVALTLQN